MERIPHRELRSNSSQILREVAAGATYEITNNSEVVAILSPPVATTLRIRPATRHGGWTEITPIKAEPIKDDGKPAPELLDELREPRV
jgi:prevent-host-death family protein